MGNTGGNCNRESTGTKVIKYIGRGDRPNTLLTIDLPRTYLFKKLREYEKKMDQIRTEE